MSQAIENLYTAFAPYKDELRLAQNVGISRPLHLMTEEDFEYLLRAEFDFDLLLYEETTFKHFLPRLLELYGLGIKFLLIYRFDDKAWIKWPKDEVEAFRGYLREFWRHSPKRMSDFEIIARVEAELIWYLENWLHENPRELAQFFWQTDWRKPPEQLLTWAKKPQVRAQFERLFFLKANTPDGEIYSHLVSLLENLALSQ